MACHCTRGCNECGGEHHTLLHEDSAQQTGPRSPAGASGDVAGNFNVHISSWNTSSTIFLATARVLVGASSGRSVVVRAILDPCSECSFISENIAQHLRLSRAKVAATIFGVGGTSTGQTISTVDIDVGHIRANKGICSVEAFVLPRITAYKRPQLSITHLPPNWGLLNLADPFLQQTEPIDLLLGVDVYGHLLQEEVMTTQDSAFIAQKTVFGWVISGPLAKSPISPNSSLSF